MRRFVFAAALALVAAAWANPAAARPDTITLSAAKKSAGRIACTAFGCHPIPRGCRIETEYDFWGNPTGYDKVVCPYR